MGEMQALAASFMERVTGTKVEAKSEASFRDALASGHLLCQMLNTLHPPLALKPRSGKLPFMQMENISLYLQGCRDVGVPEFELFMTPDLYEGKSIQAVVTNILAVARIFQVDVATPPSVREVQTSFASANILNTCRRCSKTVYATEQMLALNSVWHKACFCCARCCRTLPAGSYLDHGSDPYCRSCYDKHFRPKGYHTGAVVHSFEQERPPEPPPKSTHPQALCPAPSSPDQRTSNTPACNTPTPAPTPLSAPEASCRLPSPDAPPSPLSRGGFGAASLNRRIQGNVFARYSAFADQSAASPVAPQWSHSPSSPVHQLKPVAATQSAPAPAHPPALAPVCVPDPAPDESISAAHSTLSRNSSIPERTNVQATSLAVSMEPGLTRPPPRDHADVRAPPQVVASPPAPTTWSATRPSSQAQSVRSPVGAYEDDHQYSYLRKPRGLKSTPAATPEPSKGGADLFNSTSDMTVPYEEMKRDLSMNVLTADEATAKWAQLGINGDKREQHLADAEFQQVFNMSKADWAKLAEWKRVHLRKQHHLY